MSKGLHGRGTRTAACVSLPDLRPLAVYGLGPVGRALLAAAGEAGRPVLGFSRAGGAGGGEALDAASRLAVQAHRRRWGAGAFAAAVVTLPPQGANAAFWPLLHELAARVILIGTTSIYRRDVARDVIDENTATVPDHHRASIEASVIAGGATVVRVSGLYGDERDPIRWIRAGRIKNEPRQANLIHHADVAAAVLRLLDVEVLEPIYNLSDGERLTWRQTMEALVDAGVLDTMPPPAPAQKADLLVSPARFLRAVPGFRFRPRIPTLIAGERKKEV